MSGELALRGEGGEPWFDALVEDCRDIITEAVFTSRWALVEGYHQLGERIVTDNNFDRSEVYGQKIVQHVAQSIGISKRTLWYAIQFYETYADLSLLPEGKNITWKKLITKYLPRPKAEASPLFLEGGITLIHGDMLDEVPRLGRFDLIIADPPYGVTEWSWDKVPDYMAQVKRWLQVLQRALRDEHHLFWFCSPKWAADTEMVFRALNLPIKSRIVWHRRNMAMGMTEHGTR